MEEKLSRYDLGEIERMHDEQHYKCVNPEHLAQQLRRIGLPPQVSRFELSERIRELKRKLNK